MQIQRAHHGRNIVSLAQQVHMLLQAIEQKLACDLLIGGIHAAPHQHTSEL